MDRKKDHVVLSLSGGMDSSTLLLKCILEYKNVTAISFDYGQKHKIELERAKSLIEYLNSKNIQITYQVIKLDGLSNLLHSSLTSINEEIPHEYYAADNQKKTVVPNRNKIFSSIIQAVALSISNKHNTKCDIALGIHAGDSDIYPDCREEFRQADYQAFRIGNWDSENVEFYAPYLEVTKKEILQDGMDCCEKLNIEFNEVYKRTNTSYDPDPITGKSSGKSGSDIERILAFNSLGLEDPVEYIDGWDEALRFALEAEKIYINTHEKNR
jgi:7-cyano-7-deazaguanine synthase